MSNVPGAIVAGATIGWLMAISHPTYPPGIDLVVNQSGDFWTGEPVEDRHTYTMYQGTDPVMLVYGYHNNQEGCMDVLSKFRVAYPTLWFTCELNK